MAKTEKSGSDRSELKKLLKVAGDKPVNMAFALGRDGKAIVKLDKVAPARALEKALKEEDGSKNHRFGTVVIDPTEPEVVKFIVNAKVGGFARKLVVALKGTGFSKVKLVTEDGTLLEDAAGEDEVEDADDASPSGQAQEEDPRIEAGETQTAEPVTQPGSAAPSPNDAHAPAVAADARDAPPHAGPDAGTLAKDLVGLVKQMLAVVAGNGSQKAALLPLATAAQASLKAGDLDKAAADIDALRSTLVGASGLAAPSPGDAVAPASPNPAAGTPDPGVIRKLQKSRAVWDATLTKITADMDKLVKAAIAASDGHELGATFESDFEAAVEPLLKTVDSSLSDMLDRAAQARDVGEQQRILEEARATVGRFATFVQSHPVIGHLDDNPFVPMAVGKTLSTTLSAVSTIIR